MKAWTDLSKIPLPLKMQKLARDDRGYPIPFFAAMIDGKPDFRVVNPQAVIACVMQDRCFVCGQKITGLFAFIGGPKSMEHRHFTDGPTHIECGEYALKVCPFLAIPNYAYSRSLPSNSTINESVDTTRQEKIGHGVCGWFRMVDQQDHLLFKAGPWLQLKWWRAGKEIQDGN